MSDGDECYGKNEHYIHITRWKKPTWKGFIMNDSNYMESFGKGKTLVKAKWSVVARGSGETEVGTGGWTGREHDF
jgi:hypothetical protein